MKAAIIYYSRTGNTKDIGNRLSEKLAGSSLLEVEVKKHPWFFKAIWMAVRNKQGDILNKELDMKDYDFLLFGEPVWAGKPTPFMFTFLNSVKNLKGKPAASFVTCGGSTKENQKAIDAQKLRIEDAGMKFKGGYCFRMKKGKVLEGEKNLKKLIKLVES